MQLKHLDMYECFNFIAYVILHDESMDSKGWVMKFDIE